MRVQEGGEGHESLGGGEGHESLGGGGGRGMRV